MIANSLGFVFDANGNVISYGADVVGISILVANLPDGFGDFVHARWRWNGTELIEREDWVEAEPTRQETDAEITARLGKLRELGVI